MFNRANGEQPSSNFPDRDSLERALLEFGISAGAARQLAELGRYSLHLLPVERNGSDGRVFSKIGGVPDLPKGIEWPIRPSFPLTAEEASESFFPPDERELSYRNNPQPYNFIAQIDFEEIAVAGAKDTALPDSGALYLFYDDLSQCWGFDPKDSIGFKVIHASDISDITSVQRPNLFSEVPSYKEVTVKPIQRFERCLAEGLHFESLPISEEDRKAYIRFYARGEEQSHLARPASPAHKVRGWPNVIQNPMEEELALVTSGIHCGGSEDYNSPLAKQIKAEPNDWVLLLQIDSDDNAGMMWGDVGTLYLWIKKSDLLRRNFDDTWLILQC